MGLSGRREKQRIPNDPRNLSWADNAAKFGQAYLSKLGWDPSKGLGADGDGRTTHIKVAQKLDMLGIGAGHSDDSWKQNRDFEELLKRLNAENDGEKQKLDKPSEEDKKLKKRKRTDESSPPVIEKPAPAHRRMAHRAKHRASKNLATKSPAAISEILGIAPSSTPTPATPTTPQDSLEKITTSTKSVADYFKDRLQAKTPRPSPLHTPSHDEAGEAPRMGLGTKTTDRDESEDALRTGLGMSKFTSLTSGPFLASLSTAADIPEDEGAEQGKDDGEKARRREKKKAKKERRQKE